MLGDVLHDAVGHEVPDGLAVGDAVAAMEAGGITHLVADAASAGMAGLTAGVAGAPPPKAAPLVAGLARPVSLLARGAGDFCIAPDAAVPGGMAGVPWAAAGRFQASAVVTSTAAGTVRKMRLDMG